MATVLGNVVMGMEKCGKMCKNVWKCAGDPFSIYYFDAYWIKKIGDI